MGMGLSKSYARPDRFDRASSQISIGYEANAVAPHAMTSRATYTVPANRKTEVDAVSLEVVRITAAAPVGQVVGQLMNDSTGIAMLNIITIENAVADRSSVHIGQSQTLYPAQQVALRTEDLGTGGTNMFRLSMHGTEFDA